MGRMVFETFAARLVSNLDPVLIKVLEAAAAAVLVLLALLLVLAPTQRLLFWH